LKEVPDAERFGVAETRGDYVVGVEEKPGIPRSNYAAIGVYLYDTTVFEKIRRLKPSVAESWKSRTLIAFMSRKEL
jgi:glucose-1-phosphate thymidylyltransferase